jgi:hypothetical protein
VLPGACCLEAGSGFGLLDCVAGFAAFCGADDASTFAAAFGFFGKFGFGLGALDHGRIS